MMLHVEQDGIYKCINTIIDYYKYNKLKKQYTRPLY